MSTTAKLEARLAELEAELEAKEAELVQANESRQEMETELRTFKTLVEHAPDGISVTSLSGKILYANQSFQKMTGYGEGVIGMNTAMLLPDEALERLDTAREKLLDRGAWRGFLPHKTVEGAILPIQSSTFLIWNDQGQPKAVASINRDITEQQMTEKALRDSERRFYSLYVSMNEALALFEIVYDEAGQAIDYRFLDINPTYSSMLNIEWEESIHQLASGVFGKKPPPYLRAYNWVATNGETTSFEAQFDGLDKIFRVSVFSPEKGQCATILQDITQRKQIEQRMANYNRILEEEVAERTKELTQTLQNLRDTQSQLVESEKMAALGGLVAGVAHEINTPVGIGVSMASLLQHETGKIIETVKTGKMKISTLKTYLQTANESSKLILNNLNRAAALVQSFKQVAVDQTSLERRNFQVKNYIEEILLNLRHVLKRTKHTIEVYGDDNLSLNSFPGAFSQVVSNLVMNSLRHAYEDGDAGYMRFDIYQKEENIVVAYADDGLGIPPENLSKIFEPFFTTARSRGGSGLGLHIVYNLVTQTLKGSIRCESEIGRGTKFTLTLPPTVENESKQNS